MDCNSNRLPTRATSEVRIGPNYLTEVIGGWWVKWFWDDAANYVAMRVSVAEAVREYRARNQDNEFDYE